MHSPQSTAPLREAQQSTTKDGSMSFHSGSFDRHARQARHRVLMTLVFAGLLALGAAAVYHGFTPIASAAVSAAPIAVQSDPQPLDFDACTVFSTADAAE